MVPPSLSHKYVILYRWATHVVPDPTSWEPDPRLFPRPGLTVERLIKPYYLSKIGCQAVSYKERQYVAVFGREATERAACGGFRDVWPGAARRAFQASGSLLSGSPQARVFVYDIEGHLNATRASASLLVRD
jgi:hypothetical protein